MSFAWGFLSAAFWGIVTLSTLVIIHEGGHFIVAHLQGVRITEFFIGLPCRLHWSRKSRSFGTEFGVTPIFLGGYNRICGMEGTPDELLAPCLAIVQREGRVSAAAVAEELGCDVDRAYALLITLADWASVRPFYDPEKGEREGQREYPECFETVARDAALLTEFDSRNAVGDEGTAEPGAPCPIDGDPEDFLAHERSRVYAGRGFLGKVAILLAGPFVNIACAFLILVASFSLVGARVVLDAPVLGNVEEGSYAQAAGLLPGDRVTKVGGRSVATWGELCSALDQAGAHGGDFDVCYVRDGSESTCTVEVPEGQGMGHFGIDATIVTRRLSLDESLRASWTYCKTTVSFAFRLMMPQHTIETVNSASSVVGISAAAGRAAASGPNALLLFMALVSMSLGVMNLLPVPPLDGGKILIEVVQLIVGRPISTRAQNAVSYVGLAFFLFIFVLAVRNDVLRLLP